MQSVGFKYRCGNTRCPDWCRGGVSLCDWVAKTPLPCCSRCKNLICAECSIMPGSLHLRRYFKDAATLNDYLSASTASSSEIPVPMANPKGPLVSQCHGPSAAQIQEMVQQQARTLEQSSASKVRELKRSPSPPRKRFHEDGSFEVSM